MSADLPAVPRPTGVKPADAREGEEEITVPQVGQPGIRVHDPPPPLEPTPEAPPAQLPEGP